MTDFYRYKNIEFSNPDAIKEVQEKLLKNHLDYILRNSPYYRRVLNGFDTANVTLENLSALPFTDKHAFEEYNNELLAVPMSEIVDIVLSSGTTGKPTKIMYTENDLTRLAYNEEISFAGCGLTSEDCLIIPSMHTNLFKSFSLTSLILIVCDLGKLVSQFCSK